MKRLYLFTNFYPYSRRENFLEDEICYLSQEFDEIYLVPYYNDSTIRDFPKKCKLIPSEESFPEKLESSFNKSTIIPLIKELFSFRSIPNRAKISRLKYTLLQANHILNSKRISDILANLSSQDVLYFYWGVGFNVLAAMLKGKAKMVSRFHGQWDLWEEEYDGYLPFRKQIMANLDAVVTISQKGNSFIKGKYPYAKTCLIPLGSKDFGLCQTDSLSLNTIRILSCSAVYPLKRVDLIFRSLLKLNDLNIAWTHIGDGEDYEKVKEMINFTEHPNLEVNLLGGMPHDDVMMYLKNNRFDIFVNLSTLEGVPVSIMEAISFDIPVVATNVGGTSDVVSSECGILVSSDPTELEVAESIRKVLKDHYTPRAFWKNHYSAEKNYAYFAKFISNL